MADNKASSSRKKATGSKKKTSTRKTSKKKTVSKVQAATSATNAGTQEVQKLDAKEAVRQGPSRDTRGGKDSPGQAGSAASTVTQGNSQITWLAIVMSVAALVAGGYAWYLTAVDSRINVGQQQSRVALLDQRIDGLEGLLSDQNAQISQMKSQITESETEFSNRIRSVRNALDAQDGSVREQIASSRESLSEQTARFREEFDVLSDSIVKLRSELNRGIDSWTLEEIEQLIVVADQRLRFAGDTVMALEALNLANERLDQLADPSLVDLRQQVAADIEMLSAVTVVDVVKILGKLDALGKNVHGLALAGDVKSPESGDSSSGSGATATETGADGEQSTLDKYTQPIVDASSELLASLADLIQVEKNGQSLKPVVSAHTRQLIYERARLLLESAQVALIRQEDALYQDRLKHVRTWVIENFDSDSVQTRAWLDQLSEIQSQVAVTVAPDISGSVNAVRNAIEQQ